MSVPSAAELLAFLRQDDFLTPSQLRQLGESRPESSDGRTLARLLMEWNWLTAYQANLLVQGRGRDLILGPYRILDRLGEGGMGQVFKARHGRMDRVVAIKIIPKDRVNNPVTVGRFYREVRAVARLSHPNIVTAFEANQVGDTHYLAMEYVDGIDLARLVEQSGPLVITNACDYIRQAAIGLRHAHENGLVHRDIKPGNLVVARRGSAQPPIVKILDFGLARIEEEVKRGTRLTQMGKIVGTVDYMAPEQVDNARRADIRADIYSLGCSLFYLLTGTPPFPGDDALTKLSARVLEEAPSVRKSRPEISAALARVLAKMMARNARDRYQTPGEVVEALGPHTAEARKAASPPTPIPNGSGARSITVVSSKGPKRPVTTTTAEPPSARAASAPLVVATPRKRRGRNGPLIATLVGGAVVFLSCLGIGSLLLTYRGHTPETGAPVAERTDTHETGTPPGEPTPGPTPKPRPGGKDTHETGTADAKPEPFITNSIGMTLVLIPKGKFLMGSPEGEKDRDSDETLHEVEICTFR